MQLAAVAFRLIQTFVLIPTLKSAKLRSRWTRLRWIDDRNQENRQGDRNQENRQGEINKRYYDKGHKDYHTWDGNEDRSYQRYQTEHHQRRAFVQLNTRQQNGYWNWRHSNPDNR